MEIKVIGSSTSWTDRPTSSYCINGTILVDCGDGTLKFYKKAKVDFFAIKNIFITHTHADHIFSINTFLHHHMHYGKKKTKELTIYGPVGLKKTLEQIIINFVTNIDYRKIEEYINVIEITDFKSFSVDNLKVTPIKLKHGELTNIAYIFDDSNKRIGFSGDCTYTPNLNNFVENSDILFLECCAKETTSNHLGYDNYIHLVKKHPYKKFFATHCTDDIYKNARKLKIKLAKHSKCYKF